MFFIIGVLCIKAQNRHLSTVFGAQVTPTLLGKGIKPPGAIASQASFCYNAVVRVPIIIDLHYSIWRCCFGLLQFDIPLLLSPFESAVVFSLQKQELPKCYSGFILVSFLCMGRAKMDRIADFQRFG